MGDSAAEAQVSRLLIADSQHGHGRFGAVDHAECTVGQMLGIVDYGTITCDFHAFPIGEGFGFGVRGDDVRHGFGKVADANAAQHGQVSAKAKRLTQIATQCTDIGACGAAHRNVQFHDRPHIRCGRDGMPPLPCTDVLRIGQRRIRKSR